MSPTEETPDNGPSDPWQVAVNKETKRQQAMHDALLRISRMRALLDQSDSDTLKVAIALANEALWMAT